MRILCVFASDSVGWQLGLGWAGQFAGLAQGQSMASWAGVTHFKVVSLVCIVFGAGCWLALCCH